MKKLVLFTILALSVVLITVGCSKQQPYTGYAPYNPQGGAPQNVPVASGCGVIAPADASYPIAGESIKNAF